MNKMILVSLLLLIVLINGQQNNKPLYCQAPLPNPSENTDGMVLEMVQIITRHGSRTPLYSTLNSEMNQWDCDINWLNTADMNNEKEINGVDRLYKTVMIPNKEYLPGNCSTGQLTKQGYLQHVQLGQTFRELYIDKYELLPNEFSDASDLIWVRSTNVQRTIQSVQGHLSGLYPPSSLIDNAIPIVSINTMDPYYEDMTPNSRICPELGVLISNATESLEWKEYNSKYQTLKEEIMDALNVTVYPQWSSFMDLLYGSECYDIPLPKNITQEMVDQSYLNAFWEYQYPLSFPIISRLGMNSFFEELISNINSFVNGNLQYKYLIFSGHDGTIGGIVNLFGLLNYWPPYCSHIEIELWSNSNKEYYIQFKFNGQSYTLGEQCDNVMCPLNSFLELSETILVPDFYEACSNSTLSLY